MIIIGGIKKFTQKIFYVTTAALFVMMCFITIDVVLQITRGSGILGNFEIVQIMMVFVIYFAFGYAQFRNRHISVDLIRSRLPAVIRKIIDILISILCFAAGIFMVRAGYTNMIDVWNDGYVTASLRIPLFPFYGIVFFGCVVLLIAFGITVVERVSILVTGKEDLFKDTIKADSEPV